ncbi:MAG TPA: response regulator, partial [Treponemataceae bacterium]|nr:response regulator [Treponemataceae bacterium]
MEKAIIIADDDEMNRSILRELFKNDFDILEAADGEQVLSLLEREKSRILVILLDIIMPKM